MKFVYFGYDFMLDCVRRLLSEGHTLLGVYSFECDNMFNFNTQTQALAEQLDIPFTTDKPLPMDIRIFCDQGADVFFSGGYPYKIPPVDEKLAYGINFHPSLLPVGRGIMPTPTILMHRPEAAGMTLHKLTPEFDGGDILLQQKITLTRDDDVETLSARIAMAAPDMMSRAFREMPALWENARPQDATKAETFPMPDDEMRMLDWSRSIEEIKKTGRVFGRFGALAKFDDRSWAVYHFNGWQAAHHYRPGDVVCVLSREVIVAAKDGYICLKEFQEL